MPTKPNLEELMRDAEKLVRETEKRILGEPNPVVRVGLELDLQNLEDSMRRHVQQYIDLKIKLHFDVPEDIEELISLYSPKDTTIHNEGNSTPSIESPPAVLPQSLVQPERPAQSDPHISNRHATFWAFFMVVGFVLIVLILSMVNQYVATQSVIILSALALLVLVTVSLFVLVLLGIVRPTTYEKWVNSLPDALKNFLPH